MATDKKKYLVRVLGPSNMNISSSAINLSVSLAARSQRVLDLTPAQHEHMVLVLRGQGVITEFKAGKAPAAKKVEKANKPVVEAPAETVVETPAPVETEVKAPAKEEETKSEAVNLTKDVNVPDAINMLKKLKTADDITNAIEGDGRKTLIEAAEELIAKL